jgi:hypothetical protein
LKKFKLTIFAIKIFLTMPIHADPGKIPPDPASENYGMELKFM